MLLGAGVPALLALPATPRARSDRGPPCATCWRAGATLAAGAFELGVVQ
jgi:hypothetical protein